MAIEARRGCGFRKVGALYLIGGLLWNPCDRLHMPLDVCSACGQGLHFTRSFTRIDAYRLWGNHIGCEEDHGCVMCRPPVGASFLMMVGGKFYTVNEFVLEAMEMGACKRIPFIPKELVLGKTVVYLAHKQAIYLGTTGSKDNYQLGIFCAFVPSAVEMLVWESKATPEYLKSLEERGITAVLVPDRDRDHA